MATTKIAKTVKKKPAVKKTTTKKTTTKKPTELIEIVESKGEVLLPKEEKSTITIEELPTSPYGIDIKEHTSQELNSQFAGDVCCSSDVSINEESKANDDVPVYDMCVEGTQPIPFRLRGFEIVDDKFRKTTNNIILPKRASKDSAGYDFYSNEEDVIELIPQSQYLFWTDVKSYMGNCEVLNLYVRSSIGIKRNLELANGTGIIDSDYYNNPKNDGNIGICLRNNTTTVQKIFPGERIAQGIFLPFLIADNGNTEDLREGGIGSTNKL